MLGVCSTCQETHTVRPAHLRAGGLDDELDEFGEEAGYVMDSHDPSFSDSQCEGTGTMLQALVRE